MRNKILSLLVLLLTAATGAWAQSNGTYSDLAEEIGFGGYITLHYDYYKYDFGYPIVISTSGVIDGKGAIIDMEGANISHVFYISADNVTIKNLSIINYTGTGDAIYFSRSGGSVYNIGYDVALNRVTTANTWTLSMPASDVLLTPQYATVAKWAVESAGTPEEKTLLPVAAEGVIAGTTAPLIVEGTVANTTFGETTTAQGTVMYAVTETKTSAPALTDFSATVPTAKDYSDATTVYVWYYIEGIEPENFADRTAQNTFDNSDICTQPIEVSLLTNKFTLTLDPAPVEKVTVTIGDATDPATPDANGNIANIKMGSEVKIKANTGYKLRKVEVKKIDKNYMKWDAGQKKLVATEIPATATKVENADGNVTWSSGTYLVEGNVTIGGEIKLTGDVELIIKDGAKLTAKLIYGNYSYYSLSIYGQANMSGELNFVCNNGHAIWSMASLNIHSCNVNASISREDDYCIAGITAINVYGGSLDARYNGDSCGYGITVENTLNIYGGEVKAIINGNHSYSYGILGDNGSTLNVYGGKLWAESPGYKAIDNISVTLNIDDNYTSGKIEFSFDGTSWYEYTDTDTPSDPYVRVGY